MHFKSLPLCLLLFVADTPSSSASLFPRAIEQVHRVATKHTKSLARDLRTIFGGVLVNQADESNNRATYCVVSSNKANGDNASGSGSGSNSASGSSSTSRSGTKTATATGSAASATSSSNSPWQLKESHSGTDFFSGWDFFTGSDPTNGIVTYIDENTAKSANLLDVNSDGNAIMRVETTGTVANTRKSIRITTQSTWNFGLFIMDSVHMPTGCGTWPAFWTNGPNWPAGGEIDIVEGVNDYTNDQSTVHTNVGCSITTTNTTKLQIDSTVVGPTDCSAADTNNQGCGMRSNSNVSFGAAFNNNGGGVYAMTWEDTGIAVYFFPRDAIPSDITAGAPQPSTWGLALARWPASSCSPSKFFSDHSAIFDTTLCGDWAGGVWSSSGIPGQEQSCAARTGFSTCEAFVRASGSSFAEAYWEVKSVDIYQLSS